MLELICWAILVISESIRVKESSLTLDRTEFTGPAMAPA